MKKVFAVCILLLLNVVYLSKTECTSTINTMVLHSDEIHNSKHIDDKFTPQGEDYNPAFTWENAPENTKSFAFVCEDPDAPRGTWYHWLVINIPTTTKKIEENSNPGDLVTNSWKINVYKGPSPPKGQKHRYFFKLFALSKEHIQATNAISFYEEVNKYKIAEASIMGTYKKGKLHKKHHRRR